MTSPSHTLGSTDARMLERIKRQHAQWPYARWAWLTLSLGLLAVGIYTERVAQLRLRDASLAISEAQSAASRTPNGTLVFYSCLATKTATLGAVLRWGGIFLFIAVISRWRGNSVRALLLIIIAQSNEGSSTAFGPA